MKYCGEIVEEVVCKSGMIVMSIVKKFGKSCCWMYDCFEVCDFLFDYIFCIGKVIYYDFSIEFVELGGSKLFMFQDLVEKYLQYDVEYWCEKYYMLFEEYNQFFKLLVK